MLVTLTALLNTLMTEKTEESLNALMEKRWSIAPLDKAFTYAGGKATDTLARMARYMRVAYHSLTGRRMDEGEVAALEAVMRPVVAAMPLRELIAALRDRLYPPHMLCRPQLQTGAYGFIVRKGARRLRPFTWAYGAASPRRVYAEGYAVLAPLVAGPMAPAERRRRPARAPARLSPLSRGIGARRVAPRRR